MFKNTIFRRMTALVLTLALAAAAALPRLPLLCFAERHTVEAVLFRRTQRRRRTVGGNAVVFVF